METGAPSPLIQGQHVMAVIMVTDGVGCNARMVDDPDHTMSLIRRDLQLMQEICHRFEGQILKTVGNDGLMMYFVNVFQAVSCAIEIQKTLVYLAATLADDEVITHRIGIHLGDVVANQTDIAGDGVKVAIGVQEEAAPRGVCMSQAIYDAVKGRLSLEATHLGSLKFKNIEESVQIYQVFPASHLSGNRRITAALGSQEIQDAAEDAELSPGTLINNRYRIEKVLGHGGFGRTYLASDTHCFGDFCVLKEFVPASRTEYIVQKSRELFEREARVLYEINHPQIPRFLAWLTDKGRLFLVQEYIDGKTYAALIQERIQQGNVPFSEVEVVQWLRELLPVLSYLHKINILHRDISPENVMLPNGQSKPVLIDFGLVKQTVSQILATHSNSAIYSSQASVVGKFGYSPPEQIRMGQCYPCSDLYALGVTAIVLMTGRDLGVLMDHRSLEWQWHRYVDVSDHLMGILNKMLAEKPRERYQSAEEVLGDLRLFGPDGSIHEQSLIDLEIEIDENKRRRQVAEIVEASFFQELMQEAEGLRDNFFDLDTEERPNQVEPDRQSDFKVAPEEKTLPQTKDNPDPSNIEASDDSPPQSKQMPANAQPGESVGLDPAFLELCRREMTRFIGPLADLILKEVLAQQPQVNRLEMVEALAVKIPDSQQAREFKESIKRNPLPKVAPDKAGDAQSNPQAVPASSVGSFTPPTETPPKPGGLPPEFVNACKQELARAIGPIASFVIQDEIARNPQSTVQQMVESLASQIPTFQQAEAFKQHLSRFTR